MLSRCFLDCSVGVGVFVTGLSQISSFLSHRAKIRKIKAVNSILQHTSEIIEAIIFAKYMYYTTYIKLLIMTMMTMYMHQLRLG